MMICNVKVESLGALAGVALTNMIPLSTPGQFGIFPNIARLAWFLTQVFLYFSLVSSQPLQGWRKFIVVGFRFWFDICRANHSCIPNSNHYQVRTRALIVSHKLLIFVEIQQNEGGIEGGDFFPGRRRRRMLEGSGRNSCRSWGDHLLQVDHWDLGNNEGDDEGGSEDDHYHVVDSEHRFGHCDVSEKFNSLGLRWKRTFQPELRGESSWRRWSSL